MMPIKVHLDRLPLEPGHTQLDPRTEKRGRLKRVPAQRLPESSAYAPLRSEVIDICLPSHQPDEYGTRPSLGGSKRRAVAKTRPAFPKMPLALSAFP